MSRTDLVGDPASVMRLMHTRTLGKIGAVAVPVTTDARLTVITVRKGKPETVMVYQGAKVTYVGKALLALELLQFLVTTSKETL